MVITPRFLALLLCVASAPLWAAFVDPGNHFPDVVSPGQGLTVTGTFSTAKPTNAIITAIGASNPLDTVPVKPADDQKSVSFNLPAKIAPGRYYIQLVYNDKTTELVPSEIRVQASAVQLDSAHPTTAYRNSKTGLFDFDVVGQNFATDNLESNQIYITGQGGIIKSWTHSENDCTKQDHKPPCLWVESAEKLHVIGYTAEKYQGPLKLSVGVGNVRSTEKDLVLSRMSEAGVVAWSLVIFLVVAFVIYRLVAKGLREYNIGGTDYSPFFSFFLDKETNTYSLSKFQFLAFSVVFVYGYLYVFLCRWLVQWQFVLPDVPTNFASILGLSAGTAIAAAGATHARGSKGAGNLLPSAADFITTGGLVVPERFQFFVWTLVACFGFIALLISQNPATISGFPTFPDGLLYVMGVSSAGYLGGKLVRKPGPVIKSVAWDPKKSELTIQGENLSSEGDFFIDDHKLPIIVGEHEDLVTPTRQDQAADPAFCKELKIKILTDKAGVDLRTGEHTFRIVNKDGQFADVRFTPDPPVIKSVVMADQDFPAGEDTDTAGAVSPIRKIKGGKAETTIKVSGSGFRTGMTVRWTPSNKEPVEIPSSAVKVESANLLKITLTPGEPGTSGVLMLLTPSGFSVTATVEVVQP